MGQGDQVKTGVFVWNIKNDYTNGRIPIDDKQGAMSVVLFKVNDGLEYQTYTAEVTRHFADEVYRPQGIDFHPWGVARGWSLDIARKEGHIAGEHAAAAKREYILDLEPYKEDYWQGISGTPRAFCEGYAETSEGQNLRLCPDARNFGINLDEWAKEPIVSAWHPQLYATAFGESLRSWEERAVYPILDLGVPIQRIYPVLAAYYATPGEPSISPDDLERDMRYLAKEGYPGAALWRRGSMSQEVVARLLSMDDPFNPTPPPIPFPNPADRLIELLHEAIAIAEKL